MFSGADEDAEQPMGGALADDRSAYRSKYVEGTGWWKRPFATGWPGWVLPNPRDPPLESRMESRKNIF